MYLSSCLLTNYRRRLRCIILPYSPDHYGLFSNNSLLKSHKHEVWCHPCPYINYPGGSSLDKRYHQAERKWGSRSRETETEWLIEMLLRPCLVCQILTRTVMIWMGKKEEERKREREIERVFPLLMVITLFTLLMIITLFTLLMIITLFSLLMILALFPLLMIKLISCFP